MIPSEIICKVMKNNRNSIKKRKKTLRKTSLTQTIAALNLKRVMSDNTTLFTSFKIILFLDDKFFSLHCPTIHEQVAEINAIIEFGHRE